MQEYFNGYGEVRELRIDYDEAIEVHTSEQIRVTKFVLLSKEMNRKFSEGVITLQLKEYAKMLDEISVLTVVENVGEHVCRQDLLNAEFTAQQIKAYFNYAIENGEFDGNAAGNVIMYGLYEALNGIVEGLVSTICKIYIDPKEWKDISEYDSDEIGFMPGRNTYQTEAKAENEWKLGYASASLLPEDITSGKYHLGRDLLNKLAEGVYDDQRIRVIAIDDNATVDHKTLFEAYRNKVMSCLNGKSYFDDSKSLKK